ncbi:MAG: hypothetical protein AAF654_08305 [Myxococcota bacterium]
MTTFARLLQGASLSWGRVLVMLAAQILTVPIFLGQWGGERFGHWLVLNGMLGYQSLLSTAFQQFTYGEALRLGPSSVELVSRLYFASLPVAYLVALCELLVVLLFGMTLIGFVMPEGAESTKQVLYLILVVFTLVNAFLMPFGSITSQTLTIWGYFPYVAADGLLRAVTSSFAPAVAVFLGASLKSAGIVLIAAHALPATVTTVLWARAAKRERLFQSSRFEWKRGFLNLFRSLPLAGQTFVALFRQQGIRLVLSSEISVSSVAAFSTTRTFANVLQKGLPTIVAPLMPELMRYVAKVDQVRMEGAFAVVWLAVLAILTPASLLLLVVAEPVFSTWTRGQVPFDAVLFVSLSATVLIFGCGQPAMAVLRGRNLVAWQTVVSVVLALSVLVLLVLFLPLFGLRGVGYGLLASEVVATSLAFWACQSELHRLGLRVPWKSAGLAVGGVATASTFAAIAVGLGSGGKVFLSLAVTSNLICLVLFWRSLSTTARDYFRAALERIIRRLTRSKQR